MNIKELFKNITNSDLTKEYVKSIKNEKQSISNSEKRFLMSIISKFKQQEIEKTLIAIKLYAIWEPDESILESRRKGVFRYKAYGIRKNKVLYLLENLIKDNNIYLFSLQTLNYLKDKKNISWIYKFYKNSHEDLIKSIRNYNIKRFSRGDCIYETALFKDLLAYAHMYFSIYSRENIEKVKNRNKLEAYSREEICEGVSYIIHLCINVIGIKENRGYFINTDYVLSDEIENLILKACKIKQVEEWEVCIDYFDYQIEKKDKNYTILDKNEMLEKSIELGYVRNVIQGEISYISLQEKLKDDLSIEDVGRKIRSGLEDTIIEDISDGQLSRYMFKFPEILFDKLAGFKDSYFKEELIKVNSSLKELIMSFDEFTNKRITKQCTLLDIILFQRFFLILNEISEKILFKKKDKKKIIQSLIVSVQKDKLINIITKFLKNEEKVKELIELFTYKKGTILDLQYTPFLAMGNNIIFSTNLVAKSNLIRNAIAYSYLSKNQIANNSQGSEPLVEKCSEIFKACKYEYNVITNVNYKYNQKSGEIDVLVSSSKDIILIECKCPLTPTNNFEMRSSLAHIEKANIQLNLSKQAFENSDFRKKYFKEWGIEERNQNIRTCIVFGNRLFTCYNKYSHPIRYIYELDMVLNGGIINSELGKWSIWKEMKYSHEDLINFLSEDKSFIKYAFNSMEEMYKYIYVCGNRINFKTYCYNINRNFEQYDSNLRIITSNEELKKQLKMLEKENRLKELGTK